jgi:hypothetical protein
VTLIEEKNGPGISKRKATRNKDGKKSAVSKQLNRLNNMVSAEQE